MTFPRWNKPPSARLTVPKLCGGLNLCDAPFGIDDHQLSDGDNVWWRAGALCTRPGLMPVDNLLVRSAAAVDRHIQLNPDPVTVSGLFGHVLLSVGRINQAQNRLEAVLIQPDGSMMPFLHHETYLGPIAPMLSVADTQDGSSLGLLLTDIPDRPLLRLKTDGSVETVEPYIPTVLLRANGTDSAALASPDGYSFESFNMLTDAFRIEYAIAGNASYFHLPPRVRRTGAAVSVACVGADGEVTHSVDMGDPAAHVSGFLYKETAAQEDGYRLLYDADNAVLWFAADGSPDDAPEDMKSAPYITLTATFRPLTDCPATREVITGMRIGTWFGGDRSGLGGGTRLFVSGNPKHPSLVHYSSIHDATYFPENNYAYVGDPAQSVTALKKQGRMLVIFKQREIYYAAYQAGGTNPGDILSGAAVDVEAAAAVFPLTPLSADVGCDCPGSLALCADHLVWVNRDRKVYMLQGSSSKSQRNVRPISAPIEPLLKAHSRSDMATAKAVSVDGTYFLLIGHSVYLFRHGDIGFAAASSFSDDEAAGKHIAWYRWTLPEDLTPLLLHATPDAPMLISTIGDHVITHALIGDADRYYPDDAPDLAPHSQTVAPIRARFATREFDFGRPDRRKHIERVYVDLGDPAPERTLTVQYRTEMGDDRNRLPVPASEPLLALLPNMRRVRRFGMRCEAVGSLACTGLVIRYKLA
ncbi:MAG: hypothetical protein IKI63_00820 [Clostridia bacterium]|nr:hypothetical protein [Clostridia bacterium]